MLQRTRQELYCEPETSMQDSRKIVFCRKKRTRDRVTLNASLELNVLTVGSDSMRGYYGQLRIRNSQKFDSIMGISLPRGGTKTPSDASEITDCLYILSIATVFLTFRKYQANIFSSNFLELF